MVHFGRIIEYLSGSVEICTDSQGVLNMGNDAFQRFISERNSHTSNGSAALMFFNPEREHLVEIA